MKLAFAVFEYFPFGGMQRNMLAIARECVRHGHEIVIYTNLWEGEPVEEMNIVEIPKRGIRNHTKNHYFTKQMATHLSNEPVDLVIGFNRMPKLDIYYAGDSCFAAKAFETRSIWYRLTSRCRLLLAFEKAVFSIGANCDILLVSKAERKVFERYYQTPRERFYLLPPGISRNCILSSNAATLRKCIRQELNIADDQLLLLAIGSGFRTKGLDRSIELLAALPKNKNAILLVVGQDKEDSFISLAKKLQVNDRIFFLGGRDDIPELLQAADILLHPAYRENTGNVLIEAMVAGLPVVASEACGYAHYVVTAKMGVIIAEPFSENDFLSAIDTVLSKPRNHWQLLGKQFAENTDVYSRPQRARELIELIAEKRGVF